MDAKDSFNVELRTFIKVTTGIFRTGKSLVTSMFLEKWVRKPACASLARCPGVAFRQVWRTLRGNTV